MFCRSEGRSAVQARAPQVCRPRFGLLAFTLKQPSTWIEILDLSNCLSDKILRQQMARST